MSNNIDNPDEPKDGFDLIEYPCDYAFKAMCRVASDLNASDLVGGIIQELLTAESILKIKSSQSRTGKFESVTVTVTLTSREQLESVYDAIAASPHVVMTL